MSEHDQPDEANAGTGIRLRRREALQTAAAVSAGSLLVLGGSSSARADSSSAVQSCSDRLLEDGSSLENWSVNNENFQVSDRFTYEGDTTFGINDPSVSPGTNDSLVQLVATYEPDQLDGGRQIESYTARWLETDESFGGGMRFIDSDGDVIAGFAADNPQWYIEHSETDNIERIGETSTGYRSWVEVTVSFDWENGQFTTTFDNTDDETNSVTETRDLIDSTDVETVEVQNFANSIEPKDGWTGVETGPDGVNYSMVMYFDSIETVLPGTDDGGLSDFVSQYDTDPCDGDIDIGELNDAAQDFINRDISISELNQVAQAFID